jgi:hypothetical protein
MVTEKPWKLTTSVASATDTTTPEAYASSHTSQAGMEGDATLQDLPPLISTTTTNIKTSTPLGEQPREAEEVTEVDSRVVEEDTDEEDPTRFPPY